MGSVVISIDAELGWGFHRRDLPQERLESARVGWKRLAGLCSEYGIPATWAIVGHLFLSNCDTRHADHPRGPEWFRCEQEEWADRPSLRYGPHLIADVFDDPVAHEIGCHTFSHVSFGRPETTAATARSEIKRCLAAVPWTELSLRSFVFPDNAVGHRDILAEYGFECYRGPGPGSPTRFEKVTAATVGMPQPNLVTPSIDEYGLVNVPASLNLFSFEGRAKRLVTRLFEDPIVERARRGIDAAANGDGVFHMWLHPSDFIGRPEIARLRTVFEYLDSRRQDLRIETMGAVAKRVRDERGPSPASEPRSID